MTTPKKPKIPVILYEERKDGSQNLIPYMEVGKDEEIPKILFISSYKETGEFEPDSEHGSAAIVDMQIHQFIRLDSLKEKLSSETYDEIRIALGMKPLKEASKVGQKILDNANTKADQNLENLKNNDDERAKRAFVLGEDFRKKAQEFLKQQEKEKEEN